MMLEFSYGIKYNFILEGLGNEKRDNDLVKSIKDEFAPWEEKLTEIIK